MKILSKPLAFAGVVVLALNLAGCMTVDRRADVDHEKLAETSESNVTPDGRVEDQTETGIPVVDEDIEP